MTRRELERLLELLIKFGEDAALEDDESLVQDLSRVRSEVAYRLNYVH